MSRRVIVLALLLVALGASSAEAVSTKPYHSPLGSHVAQARPAGSGWTVDLRHPDTDRLRMHMADLVAGGELSPFAWTPDERYVAVVVCRFREGTEGELLVVDAPARTAEVADREAKCARPQLGPQGRWYFHGERRDSGEDVWSVAPDGHDVRPEQWMLGVAPVPPSPVTDYPSPDGSWIASRWTAAVPPGKGLWLSRSDGSDGRRVPGTELPSVSVTGVAWSPDGEYVSFTQHDGALPGVARVVRVVTGETWDVGGDVRAAAGSPTAWTADGRVRWKGPADVDHWFEAWWSDRPQGGDPRRDPDPPASPTDEFRTSWVGPATWLPAGLWTRRPDPAEQSSGTDFWLVWRTDAETTLSGVTWSPDAGYVAAVRRRGGAGTGRVVVARPGTRQRWEIPFDTPGEAPTWTTDGRIRFAGLGATTWSALPNGTDVHQDGVTPIVITPVDALPDPPGPPPVDAGPAALPAAVVTAPAPVRITAASRPAERICFWHHGRFTGEPACIRAAQAFDRRVRRRLAVPRLTGSCRATTGRYAFACSARTPRRPRLVVRGGRRTDGSVVLVPQRAAKA